MLQGKLGAVDKKSRVCCGVHWTVIEAKELMQATVLDDTGVDGTASGGGPEVMGGIRRLGVFGRTGPEETVWMGTAPETTTAFRDRVLRRRVVVVASTGGAVGGEVASERVGAGDERGDGVRGGWVDVGGDWGGR